VKTTKTVPVAEVEPLFNQVRTTLNCTDREILETIGYSRSAVHHWQDRTEVPTRVKYALLGLLAELKLKPPEKLAPPRFDFRELAQLFAAVLATDNDQFNPLLAKLSREMSIATQGVRHAEDR
jgi:hypothetical protein